MTGLILSRGGLEYPWTSARVLSFFFIGFALLGVFCVWEYKYVKHPMYPRRIVHCPKPFFCMMFVIFAAGINYVPLVVFWPIQSISVYQSDHFATGVHNLPIGTAILGGAIISALLLGIFRKQMTYIMLGFCIMQTIGKFIGWSSCVTLILNRSCNIGHCRSIRHQYCLGTIDLCINRCWRGPRA